MTEEIPEIVKQVLDERYPADEISDEPEAVQYLLAGLLQEEMGLTSYGQETEPESESEERSRTEEKYTKVEKIESDQYPIVIDPDFTIREIVLSKSGKVDVEINSVSGNFFEIPLNGNVISTDKFNADKIVITDRSNNSDLILGYVAGT